MRILCFVVFVCLPAGLQTACFGLNQQRITETNKLQEKENQRLQREETLKLFGKKLDEFVNANPPTKLEPKPYLKGKAVLVNVGDGRVRDSFYFGYELTEPEIELIYPDKPLVSSKKEIWNKNFGVRSIAEKPDDAQTIIQLKFRETSVCRWYGAVDDIVNGTQLCGIKAEIVIIDNTIPAVIAKKTFINNKLPKKVEVSKTGSSSMYFQRNYYQMYPFQDVEDYLKSFEQG